MIEPRLWVIDTKVLVSRLLAPGHGREGGCRALVSDMQLLSEETLGELAAVLARPRFDPYVSHADRQQFLRLLGGVSRLVHVTRRFTACRDPKDDKFLNVAMNGDAHAIVTGARELLALDPFHGVPILAPADFLAEPAAG